MIQKALEIALQAHKDQVDKAGEPYILHPLRLMQAMSSEKEQIVAILHDVVEDSEWTLKALKLAGFSEEVIEALDCLTRRHESYPEFIERVIVNDLARKVKIADLKDNLDVTRMGSLDDKDLARVKKYHKSLKFLLSPLK